MQVRTTLVLLALAVVAGVVWFFMPAEAPQPVEQGPRPFEPSTPSYVLEPRPETVTIVHVALTVAGREALAFERGPRPGAPDLLDDWKVIAPAPGAADAYMVDQFARTFAELRVADRMAAAEITPADAGLDPPAAVVRMRTRTGVEHAVEIGRKARMGTATYVRPAGGETIFVVSEDLSRELEREPGEYRSRSLLRFMPADAVAARFETDEAVYEFSKASGGPWTIESPVKAAGNNDRIRSQVNDLLRLRAIEFVEEAPTSLTAFGLDKPYLTVVLTTESPVATSGEAAATQPESAPATERRTQTVRFGAPSDMRSERRFVKLDDQPWIATVAAPEVERLIPRLSELRDPAVTGVREADVMRVELRTPNDGARLDREDGQWRGEGDLAQVDQSAVKDLLQAFEDLKAVDFLDSPGPLEQYGLAEPRAIVTVSVAGRDQPVSLRVGALTASGRNAHVQVEGQPSVLIVSERQAERLAIRPLALRTRTIFSFPPTAIAAVEVERGGRTWRLARRAADWAFDEPAGVSPDPVSIRELTSNLADMRARRVVARDADEAFGLDRPVVAVRFRVTEEPPGPPAAQEPPATDEPDARPEAQSEPPAEETEPQDVSAEEPSDGSSESSSPTAAAAEPPGRQYALRVGRKGNVAYARRDDDPFVYELDETVFLVLTQELVNRQLLELKPEDIIRVRIESTGGTLEFERDGRDWKYPADASVKVAAAKVQEFVAELARLRVDVHLTTSEADLAAEQLDPAPAAIQLTLADGGTVTLRLNQLQPGELPRKGGWVEQKRTFVLRLADVEKMMRGLDYYLQPDGPSPTPGAQPPGGFQPPPGFPGAPERVGYNRGRGRPGRRSPYRMKTCALQSGSNGNCIYVEAGDTRLLFDAGISGTQAQQRLAARGRNIRDCDALLISHDHTDHSSGAGVFARKFGLPVYVSERVWHRVRRRVGEVPDVRFYSPGQSLQFGSVTVRTVPTPHDGTDTVCFVIEQDSKRLGVLTDLGHAFAGLSDLLRQLDAAYLESNFDPEMLWNGDYPEPLKQRIAGAGGHLSNEDAAALTQHGIGARLKWLALAHLSEHNNSPQLALETHQRIVGRLLPVLVAPRDRATAMLEV